jgi:acetyl esterase
VTSEPAAEPDLDREIAGWLAVTTPDIEPTTVAEAREHSRRTNALARERMSAALIPASETDLEIDGPAGPIPVRVLRPAAGGSSPTVVYFHGGGWVIGDIDTHLGHARRICTQAGTVVASVGYRRAPEHRFPAAFDDAVAAADWAYDHLGDLGGAGQPFILAGDSVGAQLAASVAIARRDAGRPVTAQLLLYPVTDVTGRYADPEVNAGYMSRTSADRGYGLTLRGMQNFATHYVDAADSADWRVSPMRAADLQGLAPAVVHTATLDVLRTEGNFYAQALERAGVPVIAREWPTLNHSYFGLGGVSAVADSAAAQAAEDLHRLLAQVTAR